MTSSKKNLLNFSLPELEVWMEEHGLEKYRARQIFQWLYQKGVSDYEQMTDLPKELRKRLTQNFLLTIPQIEKASSAPDGTTKFLFLLEDQKRIEAVLIPDEGQNTVCLSSQVGCKYGCKFCYTGTVSFQRNLSAGEILGQFLAIRTHLKKSEKIHRLVFMGMGEPLDNWEELRKALDTFISRQGLNFSPRRITVSTAGIIPLIPEVWSAGINLAISLNSADQSKREQLMPLSKKYPLSELLKALKQLDTSGKQKLTAEYVLLKGFNDSEQDALKLAHLLSGLKIMVNLIRFNPFPGAKFEPSPFTQVLDFQKKLQSAGFMVFIRKSKGSEILAACGQLAGGKK